MIRSNQHQPWYTMTMSHLSVALHREANRLILGLSAQHFKCTVSGLSDPASLEALLCFTRIRFNMLARY
jgi:hypothetical protein